MDFNTITNLNSYIKGLQMQTSWQLKQDTGNYTAKGRTLAEWLDSTQTQGTSATSAGGQGDDKLRKIHAKLDAGGTLTPKERDYLKEKDPQAYQELVDEERAQKAYEQALRRCRTQEEAERLQLNRINKSLMVVRSVEHNSHIPLHEKLKIAMREKRAVDDVSQSTRAFIRSGEYEKLPTEAEEAAARQAQLEQMFSAHAPEDSPSEMPQQPQQEASPSHSSPPQQQDAAMHTQQPAPAEQTQTPAEADTLRKVRRAHIKSAYCSPFAKETVCFAAQPQLDEKA